MTNKAGKNFEGEGAKEGGGGLTSAVNQLAHTEDARLSVQLYTKGKQAHLAAEAMVSCLVSTISGSSMHTYARTCRTDNADKQSREAYINHLLLLQQQ